MRKHLARRRTRRHAEAPQRPERPIPPLLYRPLPPRHLPRDREPTGEEWAAWYVAQPHDQRVRLAARVIEQGRDAAACFVKNHADAVEEAEHWRRLAADHEHASLVLMSAGYLVLPPTPDGRLHRIYDKDGQPC